MARRAILCQCAGQKHVHDVKTVTTCARESYSEHYLLESVLCEDFEPAAILGQEDCFQNCLSRRYVNHVGRNLECHKAEIETEINHEDLSRARDNL